MESTRTCRKCEGTFGLDRFYEERTTCKGCHARAARARRERKPLDPKRDRTCPKCKTFKTGDQFVTPRGECAECRVKSAQGRRKDTKRCRRCKQDLPRSDYVSDKKNAQCTKCRKRKTDEVKNTHKPTRTVRLAKIQCTRCRKHKGHSNFRYNPKHRVFATVCNPCYDAPEFHTCTGCGKSKLRQYYSFTQWAHRKKRPAQCVACIGLHLGEHHDYDYRFARDVLGLSHVSAMRWMQQGSGGSMASYERRYGTPEQPKPYEPYRPDPLEEPERTLISYTNLDSQTVEGTVWCEGPKDKTVWVIRPDGGCAVVNPTKGIEVEYNWPAYVHPIPEEILQTAKDVLEGYARAQRDLQGLGFIKPIGQDYTIAATLLARHRAHQHSRKPFIEGHSARASVSTKRLRELTKEDVEVNP